jgi:transcriptional regulator with XRE-family HTH domain
MQTKHDFLENVSLTMERERMLLRLSQAEMARALNMSLSSYKRLVNGEHHKIDIYTLYRMQLLTGKFIEELCQIPTPLSECFPLLRQLSERQLCFVQSVIEFEFKFSQTLRENRSVGDFVTLIIPSGNMCDGMVYDSCDLDKVDVAAYRARHGSSIDFAIRVTSSHLQPVYQENDILLISRNPIRDGDTGIFFDRETGLAYIRRFRQTEPNRLEPLVCYGQTFFLDPHSHADVNRWIKFGYVVTKMRT